MKNTRFLTMVLAIAAVLTLGANELRAATITYEVGTCKSGYKTFSTISAALTGAPPPNVVLVCPGTYFEQIQINFPVTLQGIVAANAGQAIIVPPPNGFVANVIDDFGHPQVAQLFVNNVPTPGVVNVSDLTFDAQNQGVYPDLTIGIFYQNSSGTVNHVTTRNQNFPSTGGAGVWMEGGAANPTVTVENSSVHDFGDFGIQAESNTPTSQITATLKGNYVNGLNGSTYNIYLNGGTTSTVTGNVSVNTLACGICTIGPAAGSVSGNTVVDASYGILANADGVSVTSNKIFSSKYFGIDLGTPVAAVQSNTIMNTAIGITFSCMANPNVHSNTIVDTGTGLANVPTAIASPNSYYSVTTIRTGGC